MALTGVKGLKLKDWGHVVHEDLEYEEKDFKKNKNKKNIYNYGKTYYFSWVLLGQYHKVLIIHMHQPECVENKKPVLIYLWSIVNMRYNMSCWSHKRSLFWVYPSLSQDLDRLSINFKQHKDMFCYLFYIIFFLGSSFSKSSWTIPQVINLFVKVFVFHAPIR